MLATTRFVAVTAEIFFSIVSGLVPEQALSVLSPKRSSLAS
jgi:hypothetical protein